MNDEQKRWIALFNAVIPQAAEFADFESIGLTPEDLSPEAIEDVASALSVTHRYELPTWVVALYVSQLPRKESTHVQWLIGRALVDQYIMAHLKDYKKRGRPTKIHDRFFVAAYVEWCCSIKEMSDNDALSQAANLFGRPSYRTLRRWYFGQKGEASKERALGRNVIEFFEMLPLALGQADLSGLQALLGGQIGTSKRP